jgi:hypothetical protein
MPVARRAATPTQIQTPASPMLTSSCEVPPDLVQDHSQRPVGALGSIVCATDKFAGPSMAQSPHRLEARIPKSAKLFFVTQCHCVRKGGRNTRKNVRPQDYAIMR